MASSQSTLPPSILLMGADRAKRSIRRMAYQIAEDNREEAPVLVLGINERGFTVAQQLVVALKSIGTQEITLEQLKVGEAVADLAIRGAQKTKNPYTVLVDDVIFSGKTMLRAITEIIQQVEVSTLRTAVLIDRGHRKVPIKATFFGLQWPTKLNEHIRVQTDAAEVQKVVVETM